MGSGVGCWEAGGRRQSRRTGNRASTCFILLDHASSCFALAGSVFFILGDSAVGDGEVNISDVNAVINFILSGQATTAGDVNKDGEVSIADINAVIDIILGGN